MSVSASAVLKTVALAMLSRRAGKDADPAGLTAAAREGYDDLVRVLAPVIGSMGVEAITSRALHLAVREYPSSSDAGKSEATGFAPVVTWLEEQDSGKIYEAATSLFAALGTLLVTFIGEPLTMRLARKAWPEGFQELEPEEGGR